MQDSTKQKAVDQFLGNIEEDIQCEYLPAEEKWVNAQLNYRRHLFTNLTRRRMFVGTWNVNASIPDSTANLDPWISPEYPSPGVCQEIIPD